MSKLQVFAAYAFFLVFAASCKSSSGSDDSITVGGLAPDRVGIVFYDSVATTGTTFPEVKNGVSRACRYLEAAPSDQATVPTGARWDNGSAYTVTTDAPVGAGQGNTSAVVQTQGTPTGPGTYAAYACESLTLGGNSDWFLPSKDELALMYAALRLKGLGSFSNAKYWSSTAQAGSGGPSYAAWYQDFGTGAQDVDGMPNPFSVRAVRAFK